MGHKDILKTNLYFLGVSPPKKVVESKGSLIIYNLFLVTSLKIRSSLLSRPPAIVLYVFPQIDG